MRWLAGIGLGSVSFILLSFNVLSLPMSTSVSGSNSTRAGFLLSQKIAFISDRMGREELFLMNPDGSGLTQLTFNNSNDYNPYWSPDGTKIVFSSYRDGQSEIYSMNADGSWQTRLTWNDGYDGSPVWSPDGGKIAFVASYSGQRSIWVMNPDSSGLTQLSSPRQ